MRLQLPSSLPSTIFSVLVATFLAQSIPQVNATALTTYLSANERSCFYADVDSTYARGRLYSRLPLTHGPCLAQVSGRKSASTSRYRREGPSTLITPCRIQMKRSS